MQAHILPREKWWWLGLALLLTLAGWLYLRGYNVSLPFFAHIDEPHHLLAAQHEIDTGTARPVGHEAYPPGMRMLNYVLLKHLKPADAHYGTMLPALRLITITAWLLAVLVIALLGALLAHPLTGLMAAVIWIVNPWVVERAHWALPDAYLTLFTLLSLWLALIGSLKNQPRYSTAAVYSIMLAIVFKYTALILAPLALLLPLINVRRRHKAAWQQTLGNCVRFSVFLFWLLLLYPTLEATQVPHFPVTENRLFAPQLDVLTVQSLQPLLLTFQPVSSWIVVGALGLLLLRYRKSVNWVATICLSAALIAWLLGISMLRLERSAAGDPLRQLFAAGALLSLLYALAVTALYYAGLEALTRVAALGLSPRHSSQLVAGLVVLGLGVNLQPSFIASDGLARYYSLHDRRNDLRLYMDASVEPGMYVSLGENHKIFERTWGGYTGIHEFPRYRTMALLTSKPIEEWRNLGVTYAIMPHKLLQDDPEVYYPEETVTLKVYPVDPNYVDTGMVVLRLYPMQYIADDRLGPIRLVGYDLNTTQLQPGDNIVFRHYWQANQATDTIHHVYNHLLDEGGNIVAQVDYVPLWDDRRPTTTWDDPDEIMLGREFVLTLPKNLQPGAYQLVSGLYDPITGQRLFNDDGADRVRIGRIEIISANDD